MMVWNLPITKATIETVQILVALEELPMMVVIKLMMEVAVWNVKEAVESTLSVVVVMDRAVQTVEVLVQLVLWTLANCREGNGVSGVCQSGNEESVSDGESRSSSASPTNHGDSIVTRKDSGSGGADCGACGDSSGGYHHLDSSKTHPIQRWKHLTTEKHRKVWECLEGSAQSTAHYPSTLSFWHVDLTKSRWGICEGSRQNG